MSRSRKIIISIIAIVFLGAAVLVIKDLRWKVEQRRRDAKYAKMLSVYHQNLRLGMTRAEVADDLQSHNISYSWIGWGGNALAYAVRIGEDPSNEWYCDHWTVYVGLEFNSLSKEGPEIEPWPTDTLREIRIKKLGTCL